MTFLRGYVYTLCSCLIISSVVFTVVPNGNLRNTLKAAIGIIIALMVVSPFIGKSNVKSFNFSKESNLVDYDRVKDMEDLTQKQIKDNAADSATSQIRKTLEENGRNNAAVRISLTADGDIQKVEIENVSETEKEIISKKFGIDKDRICEYEN
ncbi:MAG: stage III sporulation protein AF [Bacillota bacterium]|nr:stage III sporulation protein AF [Bacillota bacterium]